MKKPISIIPVLLLLVSFCFAQKTFRNKEYGFEIEEPDKWIVATNTELIKNLEKFEVSEEKLTKILAERQGSVLLTSFYKYDPKTYAGLIPTIQVNVRSKPTDDFALFKSVMVASAEGFKKYFEDFTFITEPADIDISGIKSVYFVGKFTMKTQKGQEIKVRSRTYAIPYKRYFFQLNFTDGQVGEDCTKEFDELIKTIRIGS